MHSGSGGQHKLTTPRQHKDRVVPKWVPSRERKHGEIESGHNRYYYPQLIEGFISFDPLKIINRQQPWQEDMVIRATR